MAEAAERAQRTGPGRKLLVFTLLLIGLIAGAWVFKRNALPGLLEKAIVERLERRGIQAKIGEFQLFGWTKLLVREVSLVAPFGGTLELKQAELRVRRGAHWRQWLPALARVEAAQIVFPIPGTNGPASLLSFSSASTELRSLGASAYEVRLQGGKFQGADVEVVGVVTNVFSWKRPARKGGGKKAWPKELRDFLETLRVSQGSKLTLNFWIDAAQPEHVKAEVKLNADRLESGYGRGEKMLVVARAVPASGEHGLKGDLRMEVGTFDSPWGHFSEVHFEGQFGHAWTNWGNSRLSWETSVGKGRTKWWRGAELQASGQTRLAESGSGLVTSLRATCGAVEASSGRFDSASLQAEAAHAATNTTLEHARWDLELVGLKAKERALAKARISGELSPRKSPREAVNSAWGPWQKAAPYELDFSAQLESLAAPELEIEQAQLSGHWSAPMLELKNFQARLYGKHFKAQARLDVATRQLHSTANFDIDAHKISGLLTPASRKWLQQFTWDHPPEVSAAASLVMPPWNNRKPNWRKEVLPTVTLAGSFRGKGAGAFRRVPVTGASSSFTLTNWFWRLPDLRIHRTEGGALVNYEWNMKSQDYYWRIESQADIRALRPLFEAPVQKVLDQIDLTDPPRLEGEIWGRWHQPEIIGFKGTVTAKNFAYKGQSAETGSAAFAYTNFFLELNEVRLQRGAQTIAAPYLSYDLKQQLLFVTNGLSTWDPMAVGTAIGPKVRAAFVPYVFQEHPTVKVNGWLPTEKLSFANADFDIEGRGFSFWHFRSPLISGRLHWRGKQMALTNVHASFYNGHLTWAGHFDFTAPVGADFRFQSTVLEADLASLTADLTGQNRNIEGVVNATVDIRSANSHDPQSWNGSGHASLSDGFLWEIPVFGFFSPVLNGIKPGLGNSRVTSGAASFTIDRSVAQTDDLELRSPVLILHYDGKVGLDGRVDAKMEAEILRDAWVFGRVFSKVLWPLSKAFEYRITGTVNKPQSEPLYIPKVFFAPFHPIRTLKELFRFDPSPSPQRSRDPSRTKLGGKGP